MRPTHLLAAAALLAAAPAPLFAQISENGELGYGETEREDDGNSRLGLLGLLGLAGLLGLRRREPDIHVDARRDKRS